METLAFNFSFRKTPLQFLVLPNLCFYNCMFTCVSITVWKHEKCFLFVLQLFTLCCVVPKYGVKTVSLYFSYQVASSVDALKGNVRKAEEESKAKDSRISSLQEDVSKLQGSVESSAESSKKALKKLSEELENSKGQEKDLRAQLEATKKENSSPELDKYKSEASDAAKVNAELRKELEEVRIECGNLKTSDTPSKNDGGKDKAAKKESEEKVHALEEKLALAAQKEAELHAKISSLEDSKSTTSVDEVSLGYKGSLLFVIFRPVKEKILKRALFSCFG